MDASKDPKSTIHADIYELGKAHGCTLTDIRRTIGILSEYS